MTGRDLDQRFSFDTFIVGAANRLSAAAARRVAETPGKSYNPLLMYGASGLGKTHLLHAIGNQARTLHPGLRVSIDTVERAVRRLPEEGTAGDLASVELLLLDDVQMLGGDKRAQDTLLAWWDELGARNVQVVLAADRPPTEIDRLDERLLSRFSAGLICDIAPPDYDTRVALVEAQAAVRGQQLEPGVAEAIARVAFANVRELEGGVNRVVAAQELGGTPLTADSVADLLGQSSERGDSVEFDAFLTEVSGAVEEITTRVTPEQRLVDAILRFEGEGYRTYRLEVALRHPPGERQVGELVSRFAADVDRLAAITQEIREMDLDAPELARADLLRNPDRVLEAESLVSQVHERLRPLPEPPEGTGMDGLVEVRDDSPALAAAKAVLRRPGARPVPLYVRGGAGEGRTELVQALARDVRTEMPRLPIAYVRAGDLASEAVAAELAQRLDAWRGRYRRARLLVVDDFDRLDASDEVRDELYRLFDGVARAGGQIVLAGEVDPGDSGMEDRLAKYAAQSDIADMVGEGIRRSEGPEPDPYGPDLRDKWFFDTEKSLQRWPRIEDWLITELD
jgi:chromosomal replication initiation ATPase DnaA